MTANVHELKTWPKYFEAIVENTKTFEIRKNDRGFEVGDVLELLEFDPEREAFTGNRIFVRIHYITDYAQRDGYVVMSIRKLFTD